MSKSKIVSKHHQKRVTRALQGIILALLALIGILKISIGGVINVPVALLFGDIFVIFFAAQILLAFYLMVFSISKNRKRMLLIFFSFLGIIMVTSFAYASVYQEFILTASEFDENLRQMVVLARTNFSFNAASQDYFYHFGGIFGEGLLVLLTPLGPGLIITFIVFFYLLFIVLIFWPLFRQLWFKTKEAMRAYRKRRRVLLEASRVVVEHEFETPLQVTIKDAIGPTAEVSKTSILHHVGAKEKEPVFLTPPPALQPKPILERPDLGRELAEDPFSLPTLDMEEAMESVVNQTKPLNEMKEVSNADFTSLQKAVEVSGTFETVTFAPTVKDEAINESDDLAPSLPTFNKPEVETPTLPQTVEEFLAPAEEKTNEALPIEEASPTPQPISLQGPSNEPIVNHDPYANYRLPSIDLLDDPFDLGKDEENQAIARDFEQKINGFFKDFQIGAHVSSWTIGSTFTRFEIQLNANESVRSIQGLMDDVSRRLNGASVRFEPIIPGKPTSGLEVANVHRTIVNFKDCMRKVEADKKRKYILPLGKDVAGNVILAPFGDFPHLLVGGSTNSGKSVFLHTVLTSLIMRHDPRELRLMLIDPKRVELAQYTNIPHLITPIIKEPKEARVALDRLIDEMERRYKLFEQTGVNKMNDYNEIAEEIGAEKLPLIITIVDEFADLVESEKEVSGLVLRLVQKSRAAGIHMLIATQRPSVQVITGNIKANLPSRVAFMTASAIDSMTILGQGGAELLLGLGDMLVDSITVSRGFLRVQSPYVATKEVMRVTNYLRTHYKPTFFENFLDLKEKTYINGSGAPVNDDLYPDVLKFTQENETISISRLQQQFGIGWPRARTLYDMLMSNGVIEPPDEANSAKGAIVIINKHG